jgi:hypothetical protein
MSRQENRKTTCRQLNSPLKTQFIGSMMVDKNISANACLHLASIALQSQQPSTSGPNGANTAALFCGIPSLAALVWAVISGTAAVNPNMNTHPC